MREEINAEMVILARESRGMTQAALARAMNVQQGTVSKIEAGLQNPSEEMIDKLERTLRYPRTFFIRMTGFTALDPACSTTASGRASRRAFCASSMRT